MLIVTSFILIISLIINFFLYKTCQHLMDQKIQLCQDVKVLEQKLVSNRLFNQNPYNPKILEYQFFDSKIVDMIGSAVNNRDYVVAMQTCELINKHFLEV